MIQPDYHPISIYNTVQQLWNITSSHEINDQIEVDVIALSLKIPVMYGLDHCHVDHCNDCSTGLHTLRNCSGICGAYALYTWIKHNGTVPAPSSNDVVSTQR